MPSERTHACAFKRSGAERAHACMLGAAHLELPGLVDELQQAREVHLVAFGEHGPLAGTLSLAERRGGERDALKRARHNVGRPLRRRARSPRVHQLHSDAAECRPVRCMHASALERALLRAAFARLHTLRHMLHACVCAAALLHMRLRTLHGRPAGRQAVPQHAQQSTAACTALHRALRTCTCADADKHCASAHLHTRGRRRQALCKCAPANARQTQKSTQANATRREPVAKA
jgi:hypothetical protein